MKEQKSYKFKASNWNKEDFLADMRFVVADKKRLAGEIIFQAEAIEEFILRLDMQLIEVTE